MGRTASNHWTKNEQIPGERYCEVFGHLVKKFGDGRFCINCDKPEAAILDEKWAAGSIAKDGPQSVNPENVNDPDLPQPDTEFL